MSRKPQQQGETGDEAVDSLIPNKETRFSEETRSSQETGSNAETESIKETGFSEETGSEKQDSEVVSSSVPDMGVESTDARTPLTSVVPGDSVKVTESSNGGEKTQQLSGTSEGSPSELKKMDVRPYGRRYLMLLIFCLQEMTCGYQWIHLSIIGNVLFRYYDASLPEDSLQRETAVDWLAMVFFLTSLVTFLPVLWVIDFKGLRVSLLLSCALLVAGTWLKVAAVNPDLFALLLAAQTLCGLSEVYILPAPPRLAAVWFGPGQLSTACSMGVLANQIGIAIGFLLPPVVVPDSPSLEVTGSRLRYLLIGGAVYSTLVMVLVIFFFKDKPPTPPSQAEALVESRLKSLAQAGTGFKASLILYRKSLMRLLRNRDFRWLMLSYGLNTGSYYAISTLLNSMILYHHPGKQTSAGQIGLTIVFSGLVASLVAGLWLDKTKTFKPTSLAIYVFTVLGMVAFTFTLNLDLWIIYLTAGALGFFLTGFIPVAFQFAAEITYPEPEGSSSGLLTASAMLLGIVMTLGMRAMMNQVSILAANLFVSAVLLIGTIVTVFVRSRYLRQEAERSAHAVTAVPLIITANA